MAWREDESGTLTVTANQVRYTAAGGNKKANAIWSKGGTGSWEFKISGDSGTWVGVAAADKFGAGYSMKGLFYGGPGNLSDGSSLVTGHWGPKFGDGDVIGMRVELSEDRRVQIAFAKNGVGLGAAFDISDYTGGELCPAVSMDTEGQAVVITEMPSGGSLEDFRADNSLRVGVEGEWKGRFNVIVVREGEGVWRVCAKVANSMSCVVKQEADGKLVPGPVMCTRMMPPPELQQLEQEASALLEGLTGLRREGENLVLEANGAKEVFMPHAGPGPAGRDIVNWLN